LPERAVRSHGRKSVGEPRFHLRHQEKLVPVLPGELLIGRAPDCALRLNDGLVSRHHARLRLEDEELVVEDLSSRNGVLVNERKIHGPVALSHGDVIGIGLASLEVVDDHVLHHPAHLSTLPPPSPRASAHGQADVDGPDQVTVAAKVDVLTDREREVLELIVLGHTQREIGERLHVSVKTIETHRANISAKLNCNTRAELVSYAIAAGLLKHRGFAR
jgi:DNA-binding CsgD family transcriptional regulator